ncbi:MAG TPA: serine/threonine-protein kinase, partial [Kofleriaceae bacterium]|nr:serine/threonine-protein kinase [Kofleriaceae bacterium]
MPTLILPTAPVALLPDDIIDGRYRILQQLADGGMGTVFLAEHVLIKRRFALKVLHRELAADTEMVQRFMNEALAAGTLGHPHIVEATDMGFTPDGVPFIVFEYLEGAILTEEIYRVGGMPVRRAVRIARQIASALECAHNANIVHLDLKCDNIFLTDKDGVQDHVKVLDFGIARFLEVDLSKTQRYLVAGTPDYMAPEQITEPETVDKRADIYALGVLLYEMLTARRPFAGDEDARSLLYRIVHEAPRPLGERHVPPELERLIFERLLVKDRAKRFQSMAEVDDALDEIVTATPTRTMLSPHAVTRPLVGLPRLPSRSRPAGTEPPPSEALLEPLLRSTPRRAAVDARPVASPVAAAAAAPAPGASIEKTPVAPAVVEAPPALPPAAEAAPASTHPSSSSP